MKRAAATIVTLRRYASRVFAATLLFTFLIGSIVARDVALMQQVRLHAALAELEERPASIDHHRKVSKPRPSGFSKRTAWSPTDTPDDDDETDEDSDTFSAHPLTTLVPVAWPPFGAAVVAIMPEPPRPNTVLAHHERSRAHEVRGPPHLRR